jgi:hypothetical protein
MKIDWELLTQLEPRLLELFNEAQEIRRTRSKDFFPNNVWYHGLKDRMCNLVGFDAVGEGVIRSSEAYDLAYSKIYYEALRGLTDNRSNLVRV